MPGARFDLGGRVALVTGSARGIGRALAAGLAGAGARLAVHGRSDSAELGETVAALRELGQEVEAFACDLEDMAACRKLVRDVRAHFGALDILILNASYEARSHWRELSEMEFDRHVAINLKASLVLLQESVPAMAARGFGRVVTIGSIQEAKPNPRLLVYAALKSAQTALAVGLAREVAGNGVTVNNIAPGAIATERNRAVLADAEYAANVARQIPVGRIGVPEDCVGACLLLCSEAGSYINGASLYVDGGWHRA